jgi:hypothetical protein
MDFSDFVQPLILEKAEEFNPRQAKARFERVCALLGEQAFWLVVFEYLEKHQESVSGMRFVLENQHQRHFSVVDSMLPVLVEGAAQAKAEKALKAFPGAMSKARGKIRNCDRFKIAELSKATPANGLATLSGREQILAKALGPDLYGLRLSRMESKELDSVTRDQFAAALSGRPARSRL